MRKSSRQVDRLATNQRRGSKLKLPSKDQMPNNMRAMNMDMISKRRKRRKKRRRKRNSLLRLYTDLRLNMLKIKMKKQRMRLTQFNLNKLLRFPGNKLR